TDNAAEARQVIKDWISVTESPNSRYCRIDDADSSVGRLSVYRHNEKMLPSSYSIAAWQHWLCITFDTVWCITSTRQTPNAVVRACGALKRAPGSIEARRTVGLILRNGLPFRFGNGRVRHGSHSASLVL